MTPRRDLVGIDELREELTWIAAPENFDLESDEIETDLGGASNPEFGSIGDAFSWGSRR